MSMISHDTSVFWYPHTVSVSKYPFSSSYTCRCVATEHLNADSYCIYLVNKINAVSCQRLDVQVLHIGRYKMTKIDRNTKIGRKVVRATADIPHQLQNHKVNFKVKSISLAWCGILSLDCLKPFVHETAQDKQYWHGRILSTSVWFWKAQSIPWARRVHKNR